MRNDLKMGKGKMAVQAGHAAVSATEEARKHYLNWWKEWLEEGQCKITVKVGSENELLKLEKETEELGLPHALISDRGLTQLLPGTITCLGIGPAPSSKINKITGKLELL